LPPTSTLFPYTTLFRSWAPFMGLFIARISRGRTVRQFITGVLLVPSVIAILWFSTFGGTALNLDINHGANLGEIVNENVELSLLDRKSTRLNSSHVSIS